MLNLLFLGEIIMEKILTILSFQIHEHGICLYLFNINNLIYADDTTLMAESEEELKSLLMKVKEESKIVGLRLKISEN